ncbi:N-acetylmuramoyl-L-alanine amidase [Pseudoxanthomonas kalamensis DSM 18571]|uniref:N-acetylmuramoyl-L-alanine amidase n=1 Tax=Pseudoxanthomonas kalamensis TaxID=289483 RepID=UPI001391A756|nr:N-acetylmuramoyl-L-alanine amidase [Pseudoxanthomonas kalamensis]KAF1709978.1 N-acetylmuramoyl-L-alanine amidase [Pseudoxanthomonas kalamensis DSM 18571]
MRMGNVRIRAWLAGSLLALGAAAPAFSGEIRDVRLSQGATGTRVEIELVGRGEFKTLSLSGPDRLVVDLGESSMQRGLQLPAGTGVVKAVRSGQPVPGTLRLVFDLAAPVAALQPRVEASSGGSRLVIEWPGDGPVPAVATTSAPVQASTPSPQQILTQSAPSSVQVAATQNPGISPQSILDGQATAYQVPATTSAAVGASLAPATAGASAILATVPPSPPGATAPAPATTAPAAAAPKPAAPLKSRPLIIAIDAGHGGQDSGAVGPSGKYEKHVVLAIARELARQVDATPGMKAYLVRDGDYFIPLPNRAKKARAANADLFVSIHADAAENRSAKGSSVYVLSLRGASSQRARWLADKENASDLVGGVKLQQVGNTLSSVLIDLAQSGHMRASEDAANQVLSGLKRVGNNHKPQIERANFAVLRTSDMPAMLVETAFISNPDEEKRLTDPAFQRKLAGAVLDGVQTYFTRQPPPGTLFAARAQAAEAVRESTAVAAGAGSP